MIHGDRHVGEISKELKKKIREERVQELLKDQLNPSECIQTKSGKYCCLVCPGRVLLSKFEDYIAHKLGKKHKMWLLKRKNIKNIKRLKEMTEMLEKKEFKKYNLIEKTQVILEEILNPKPNLKIEETVQPIIKPREVKPKEVKPIITELSPQELVKLSLAGWSQNNEGMWTRDENVEFDSDEDILKPPGYL